MKYLLLCLCLCLIHLKYANATPFYMYYRPATDPHFPYVSPSSLFPLLFWYYPYFFTSFLKFSRLVELAGECSLHSTKEWLLATHWPQHIMESISGEYFFSFHYQSLQFPMNIQLRDFAPFHSAWKCVAYVN